MPESVLPVPAKSRALPPVVDRPLAFVDLETTGGTATRDRITEIAIISFDGERCTAWHQLIDPGVRIPPYIEQLTGITNDMVIGQPAFADLAPEILRRLEGHVFVAHNARFDYGFLKNEFRRSGLDFRLPVLCTVKLSRRLYPEHHHHNLDSLIARHGLAVAERHRALGDADAIFQFWQTVRDAFSPDLVRGAVRELTSRPSLPSHLDADLVDQLPGGHGVYLFYADNDSPLYVGKSNNLRQRVMSHFTADHSAAKEMSLSQQVRRVDWIECAGEVEALLTESRLVKELQPTLNRQLRRNRDFCSWLLVNRGFDLWQPELVSGQDLDLGRQQHLYGLFKGRRDAKEALSEIAKAQGLCPVVLGLEKGALGKPCFARQLKRCQGACVGEEPLLHHSLRLMEALERMKLQAWPFPGPAFLPEGEVRHVVDAWCYLGAARTQEEVRNLLEKGRPAFERDTYRILVKHVDRLVAIPEEAW